MSIVKEFFLTTREKEFFDKWLANYEKEQKPLLIRGIDGNGKTTLAKEILKQYSIIHINIDFIYGKADIFSYIENSITKKDICFMFDQTKQVKALLIDDLQLYIRMNKGFLKKLLEVMKQKKYPRIPIIIICNQETNKAILSITDKCILYEHSYSLKHYSRILSNKINLSDYKLNKYIVSCKYNLNTIMMNLSTLKNDADSKKELKKVTVDLFHNDYSIDELLRMTSSEYTTIGFNMIEGCVQTLREERIIDSLLVMYQSQIESDMKEVFYKNNEFYDSIIFSNIVIPHRILRANSKKVINYKYSYNTYLSQSLIYIHNQKQHTNHNLINKGIHDKDFLILLVKEFLEKPNLKLLELIQDILYKNSFDKKFVEKRIKIISWITDEKLDSKKIHNLIHKYNMNYSK